MIQFVVAAVVFLGLAVGSRRSLLAELSERAESARDRAQLVVLAYEGGLVTPGG